MDAGMGSGTRRRTTDRSDGGGAGATTGAGGAGASTGAGAPTGGGTCAPGGTCTPGTNCGRLSGGRVHGLYVRRGRDLTCGPCGGAGATTGGRVARVPDHGGAGGMTGGGTCAPGDACTPGYQVRSLALRRAPAWFACAARTGT